LAVLDATLLDATHPSVPTSTELGSSKGTSAKIQLAQDLFLDVTRQDRLKDRSGHLALLELERRVRAHGLSQGLLTTSPGRILDPLKSYLADSTRLITLLKEYFDNFGDKACCFEDLKPFLDLEESDLSQFTSFLQVVPTVFVS